MESVLKLEADNLKLFRIKTTLKDKVLIIAKLLYEKRFTKELNGTFEIIKDYNSCKILDLLKSSLIILLKQFSKQEIIIDKFESENQRLKFDLIKYKELSCIEKINISSDIKDLSSIESLVVKSLELKVISLIKDKSFLENLVQTFVSVINNSKIVQLVQDMITTHNIITDLESKKRDILAKLSYEECIDDVISNYQSSSIIKSNVSCLISVQKELMEINDKLANFNGIMKKLHENLINTEIISDSNMINLQDCEQKLIVLYNELSMAKNDFKSNKLNFMYRKNNDKVSKNITNNKEILNYHNTQTVERNLKNKRSNSLNKLNKDKTDKNTLYKKRKVKSTKHYITPTFSLKNSDNENELAYENNIVPSKDDYKAYIKKNSIGENNILKDIKEVKDEKYEDYSDSNIQNLSSYNIIEDAIDNINYPLSFRYKN